MVQIKKLILIILVMGMGLIGIVVILDLFTGYSVNGKLVNHYYVSNSGNDNNSGMHEEDPWQTIEKVNSTMFGPGDVIHFKRGDVWREQLIPVSGNEKGLITYTSYGSGSKPLLLGSVDRSNIDDWSYESRNIWELQSDIHQDVGNLIFNHGKEVGVKVMNENDLNEQNRFWYDKETKTVKIYSLLNPAELYNSIECALTRNIIPQDNRSYINYDGLTLKYGGAHGIGGENTHHIRVSNCDISYIGGGTNDDQVRYGNGIEFWNNAHDNSVENCSIGEIYDAALTNQGIGTAVKQYNIIYKNNTIWNAEYSFEYFMNSIDGQTHNIVFEKNNCSNAGGGWGHYQRPDPSGRHICFWDNNAQTEEVIIRDNTFVNAKETCFYISKQWNGIDNLVYKNNKCLS